MPKCRKRGERELILRGIKPMASARDLVAQAREQAGLDDAQAMEMALQETRAHRAAR